MKKDFKITVLPGDGVGPEVTSSAITVLKSLSRKSGFNFIFNYADFGAAAINKHGNPLPDETLAACRNCDAVLLGAIGDPKYDNDPAAKVRPEQGLLKLRKSLNLYANLRPIKVIKVLAGSSPLKKERIENTDLIVVRELTGGIYFGEPRERRNGGETAVDTSIYSRDEVRRIAKLAFETARGRRKKVTSVDKANVLETSRLWRETVSETAVLYPDAELTHMFVDNAAMQLIKRPAEFDVILTENMFGDILTDEASVIAGSIGLLPSASVGTEVSLYEPIHGSYPKAAGKNTANPIGTILSAAMMLRMSFKLEQEAAAVETAVEKFLIQGWRTKDIADEKTDPEKIVGTKETAKVIALTIN